ncbi:MAG: DUF4212 domain-containing protein [Phycisphaerales bacterium JB059]
MDQTPSTTPPPPARSDDLRRYWRLNLLLVGGLLLVWAGVSLGLGVLLVEPLNRVRLGGAPLGFWIAQQGAIYVFVLLILIYVLAMRRLDRRFGVRED